MGSAGAGCIGHAASRGLSARTLAVVLAVAPLVAVFSPLAMAPLFALAVLAAMPALRHARPLRWPPKALMLPLAGFHLWQAISILWCLDVAQALRSTAAMTALTLGGAVLFAAVSAFDQRQARLVVRAAVGGLLVGGVVFVIEAIWGIAIREVLFSKSYEGALFPQRLNRPATIMAVLVLPVGLALWQRRHWALLAALAVAVVAAIAVSTSATAKVCLVLGPVIFALAWRWGGPLALVMKGGLMALLVVTPFAINALPDSQALWDAVPQIPSSSHHRLTIWKFASMRALEKPVFGWGMDASRKIPGGEDEVRVVPPPGRGAPHHEQLLPLHPHNSILQWWLELGGVGVAIGAAMLLGLVSVLGRSDRFPRALGLGLLAQGVVVASLSFGAWQSWWISTLWLMTCLSVALIRQADWHCQNGEA